MDNTKVEIADVNKEEPIRKLLDSSYQGVKRLFVMKFLLIISKNIFFQGLKLKTATSKLMEEIFMINQLMTRSSNTTKSGKYQQDKVMITRRVVCWILLIIKTITD